MSGDRDDETPQDRPRRRAQTSTERDLEGLRARAERDAATGASIESERSRLHRERKAARTHPRGVPIADHVEREFGGTGEVVGEVHDIITEPWKTLDREELKPYEAKIVERSKRNSSDPITVADWAKTMALFFRKALDERSAEKKRADEYMAILDATPNGKLAGRVTTLEKRSTIWNRVIGTVLVLVAGGLLAFVDRIWDRSAHETALQFRLQAAEKALERQDATIERLERRVHALQQKDHTP